MLEIKKKIIQNHNLDKMFDFDFDTSSINVEDCENILKQLKSLLLSEEELSKTEESLKKFKEELLHKNGCEIKFSINNIGSIRSCIYLSTNDPIDILCSKKHINFDISDKGLMNKEDDLLYKQKYIEIGLLRLMFLEQIEGMPISTIDELQKYLEKVEKLYSVFFHYRNDLYFNDVHNFIYYNIIYKLLKCAANRYIIYYLDDFIDSLKNFQIIKWDKEKENLFSEVELDELKEYIVSNSNNYDLYFIKKLLYEEIKTKGKIDTSVYKNIIDSIPNYVPANEVINIKEKVQISKGIFEYFYKKYFNYDGLYIKYDGNKISSIEFFTKKLDQMIVEDLEKKK